jgi:putative Mn2+ efflux pump MntP
LQFKTRQINYKYRNEVLLFFIFLTNGNCFHHFQQYFSYIVAVSFITRKIPPTCGKSLTNFIPLCCIEHTSPWAGFELTALVRYVLIAQVIVKPDTKRSRPRRPSCTLHNFKYRRKISMVIYPVVTVHHKPDS